MSRLILAVELGTWIGRALAWLSACLLCSFAHAQVSHIGENLCPISEATHTMLKVEGEWHDPVNWDHGVPGPGARVYIPCNHFCEIDTATADVQWIHCEGVLKVCEHCDTQINVHTLYVPHHGVVMLGDKDMPVTGKAVVEYISGPEAGLAGDFLPGDLEKLSLGLICHGMFTACGTEKTAWATVSTTTAKGATQVTLDDLTYEWKPGDDVLIAGTDYFNQYLNGWEKYQSEFRKLTAVDLRTLTVDQPLQWKHFNWRSDLPYHVANLTRNVVIRSRHPESINSRGHMMFMSSMNDIRYTLIDGMGRTDKSQPVTDPRRNPDGTLVEGSDANPRGRYADHNHKCGPLAPPAIRKWVVVRGSPGWGMVNHTSNCEWDNCIAVECFGAGFVTEEGQERGRIQKCLGAMNRGMGDIVVSADSDHGRAYAADWGMDGSGFWMQGGLVEVRDCVSFDNSGRGFALHLRTFNGYPAFGSGNPMPDYLRYPVEVPNVLLHEDYFSTLYWTNTNPKPTGVPSMYVPQKVFDGNTAYGNKVCIQGWAAIINHNHTHEYWPLSQRASLTNMTMWGRGCMLHLEYMRQVNIDGLKIVGDLGFRPNAPMIRLTSAVLFRSPHVTMTDNWEIDQVHCALKMRVEGVNDPGGIAAKNIVVVGSTVHADGKITTP